MAGIQRLPSLRHRDFRLLWLGQLFSMVGSQMQLIGVNWHVYLLLRNHDVHLALWHWQLTLNAQAIGLGTLGAARILPIFLFAFLGGAVADHWDRRQIILWSQIVACLCAVGLGLLTLGGLITVPLLYLFTALDAGISAFNEPAQTALYPELVPRTDLANATTLFTLIFQIGTIIGPLLAGTILASSSVGWIYLGNAISYLIVVIATALLKHRGQTHSENGKPFRWHEMLDGFRFVRRTQVIWGTMLLDFYATLFGSARTMLPLIAGTILHVGPQGYAILATAQPIGSVAVGAIMAVQKPFRQQGKILLISVALYGLATALFGISNLFILSYLLFGLTGVGDTISTVIRGTIRQELTPSNLLGRMTAVQMILAMGGPQLGEVESGLLAAMLGPATTIFIGGILTCATIGWLAYRNPALRAYTHETKPAVSVNAATLT